MDSDRFFLKHAKGNGYRLVISDIKKRVIDNAGYNLVAELPVLEQFIEDNGLGWMFPEGSTKDKELSIGYIRGSELFDMDMDDIASDDFIPKYINWLNNDNTTWDLDALEEKWYALEDAEGNLHATVVEEYQGFHLVPTAMDSGELDAYGDPIVYMTALFFDDEDLVSFMMVEDGAYHPVQAEDLKKDLVLTPCMILESLASNIYAPISTPFTITPENIGQIKLKFKDINEIPDIADTTGDGKKLTKQVVITDIYNVKINLQELLDRPTGELTHIDAAVVLNDEYTGEELNPRVVCDGKTLKEGVDYKLTKWADETAFKDIGNYSFLLEGMGDFIGNTIAEYKITPPSPRYIILNGANASWQKGSGRSCDFLFKRNFEDEKTYDLFKGIQIDSKDVDASNYTYEKGSVLIHLKSSYLETLSVGDHSIVAVFADGQSKATRFTIRAKDKQEESRKTYILPLTGIE